MFFDSPRCLLPATEDPRYYCFHPAQWSVIRKGQEAQFECDCHHNPRLSGMIDKKKSYYGDPFLMIGDNPSGGILPIIVARIAPLGNK